MSLTSNPGMQEIFCYHKEKQSQPQKQTLQLLESEKAKLEAHNLETKKEADALAEKLNGQNFVIIRSASDTGALYGSVTPRDAAEAATEAGFTVDRKQFSLKSPIKELGLHEMEIKLHPEVSASVIVNVARSQEEAELQASGKSIQDLAAEQEQEAEFEIAELFDDIGSAALDEDLGLNNQEEEEAEVENEPSEDAKTE